MLRYLAEPFPRDPSQEEARRELSRDIYRREEPSLLAKILDWFQRTLSDLAGTASDSVAGGNIALLIVVIVLVALIVALLWRFGPLARVRRRRKEASEVEPTRSEEEHRNLADQLAAEGKFAEAVRERLRAIVRNLITRGLLDDRPGRTAMEIADEAGRELPTSAEDLMLAANLFGAIWYGRRPATAEHDATMRGIAERVAAARPVDQAVSR